MVSLCEVTDICIPMSTGEDEVTSDADCGSAYLSCHATQDGVSTISTVSGTKRKPYITHS